jgi:hypothetical protein
MLSPTWIPPIPVGIAAVIIGAAGVIVSFNPPTGRVRWAAASIFTFLCVLECGFIWRSSYDQDQKDIKHESDMAQLQSTIQTNEMKNYGDLEYLKGRLDEKSPSIDLSGLSAAITKNTDRIVANEVKKQSDKELIASTESLAADMINFEAQARAREESIGDQRPPVGANADQIRQFYIAQSRRTTEAYQDESAQFRSQFLVSAVACRDQLIARLKSEGKEVPSLDPARSFVFQGVIAGVSPISDGANYLQTLARQLQE